MKNSLLSLACVLTFVPTSVVGCSADSVETPSTATDPSAVTAAGATGDDAANLTAADLGKGAKPQACAYKPEVPLEAGQKGPTAVTLITSSSPSKGITYKVWSDSIQEKNFSRGIGRLIVEKNCVGVPCSCQGKSLAVTGANTSLDSPGSKPAKVAALIVRDRAAILTSTNPINGPDWTVLTRVDLATGAVIGANSVSNQNSDRCRRYSLRFPATLEQTSSNADLTTFDLTVKGAAGNEIHASCPATPDAKFVSFTYKQFFNAPADSSSPLDPTSVEAK